MVGVFVAVPGTLDANHAPVPRARIADTATRGMMGFIDVGSIPLQKDNPNGLSFCGGVRASSAKFTRVFQTIRSFLMNGFGSNGAQEAGEAEVNIRSYAKYLLR